MAGETCSELVTEGNLEMRHGMVKWVHCGLMAHESQVEESLLLSLPLYHSGPISFLVH